MDTKSYGLKFSADVHGLRQLYDFVSDVAVYLNLDEKTRFDMELVLEEAVTNIINHAYHGASGDIVLTITYEADQVKLVLQDWGDSFDGNIPNFDYSRPVEERINGGMGMHFIRTLMDNVAYEPSPQGGTILTMTKTYATNPPLARDELQIFEEVSRALSSVFDVNTLLNLIVSKLTQVVEADRGTLYLVNAATHELYSVVLQTSTEYLPEIRLKIGQGIAGFVAESGETVNIRNAQDDPHFAAHFDSQSGYQTHNMICTPMRNAKEEIIGVIQLINKKKGHFTSRDETFLKVLASQAAIAYENARLIEAEKSKRNLSDTLREVAAIINSSLELDTVLTLILEQLARVIPYKNGSILMVEGEHFVVRASRGAHAETVINTPVFRVADSVLFRDMIASGRPSIIPDIQHDRRWIKIESTDEMHSWLGMVLKVGDKVIGELGVIHTEADFYTAEHADIIAAFANQASAAIERARLHHDSIQQARLRQELETAFRIQSSFLPDRVPQRDGWQIAATWQPAQDVGGDFYDFIELPDGRLGFVIADVSGKGVPAALFMALARTIFRIFASEDEPIVDLMAKVNEHIRENNRARFFVTAFYGVLDPHTGKFCCVNGGHNPPLLVHDGAVESLTSHGAALGLFGGLTYDEYTLYLAEGDILVLYTDGITEAINAAEDEFGEEQLAQCLSRHHHQSADAVASRIKSDIDGFVGDVPQYDDSTLVIIKRLNQG